MELSGQRFNIGILLQTNYGSRHQLLIAGAPVGRQITDLMPKRHQEGSCIAVLATDLPLHPGQLRRLARRVDVGLGRTGSVGNDGSGDIFIAFSTANPGAAVSKNVAAIKMLPNGSLDPVFAAVVQTTEESIVNAMIAADSMTGIDNHHVTALDHEKLRAILKKYNRLN